MKNSARTRVASLFLVIAPAAAAQDRLWIQQLGTSGQDSAGAFAPDGSGGVYMAGTTAGSLGGPNAGLSDIWLGRYDGASNQLWIRQLGTSSQDEAFGAAEDGAGGAYVLWSTSGPPGGPNAGNYGSWLARYDGAGNQLWMRLLGGIGPGGATGVATDGAGGSYLSGLTGGSIGGPNAGGLDAWVARYDGAGNQVWIRQLGTSGLDNARDATQDGAGGVYVSGATTGSLGGPNAGNSDTWVARYDGAGNQLWIRQVASSGDDYPLAAAPDGAGGVYMTGLAWMPGTGHDAFVTRYDGAGNQVWIRQIVSSDGEQAWGAAPDGAGGVYVSGIAWGSLGGPSAGGADAWLARYDGTGNQRWLRQFGTSSFDGVGESAPDGAGGVFLGGATYGSLGGPNAGAGDAWLARHAEELGTRYCSPATVNSTGQSAVQTAIGSSAVVDGDLTLIASLLPAGEFGYFLAGRTQGGFTPPGSQGTLCLAGNIGRYRQIADLIRGPTGSIAIDLTSIPVNPSAAIQPGETWNFQCWFRDHNPALTSNFTNAVSVAFR